MQSVDMKKWKQIWESKQADEKTLSADSLEAVFMELKRIDGNDTIERGGVTYSAFRKQYLSMVRNMRGEREKIESVFEAGCGSGPFLLMFAADGLEIGGMDYSKPHIETAKKVLKTARELYCDEAVNMLTDIKYDCVYSNSMFEYFEDMGYAMKVLDKMCEKANYCTAVLDVHDKSLESEWLAYRRSKIEDYDKKYENLNKLFYSKSIFVDYATAHGMDIKITTSKLDGYWNRDFVFDVYLYKN